MKAKKVLINGKRSSFFWRGQIIKKNRMCFFFLALT